MGGAALGRWAPLARHRREPEAQEASHGPDPCRDLCRPGSLAGAIQTNWHRICTKDLNLLGSWAFTGNDLALGVDMLYRARARYPWFDMQTLYPFDEDGVSRAVADALAMRTVKSTIVPWPELLD